MTEHTLDETPARRFVLEFIDPDTGCIRSECRFEVRRMDALRSVVDPQGDDPALRAVYELDRDDIAQLASLFGVVTDGRSPSALLRSWRPMDDLPYVVHTNRELGLMLAGAKPFAAFSACHPPPRLDFEIIPESRFEPYVRQGLFSKAEYNLVRQDGTGTRFVLYAAKGEEWRAEAYMLLQRTAEKSGWSEGFERMEGSLLGYEEWQNDLYIAKLYRKKLGGS